MPTYQAYQRPRKIWCSPEKDGCTCESANDLTIFLLDILGNVVVIAHFLSGIS